MDPIAIVATSVTLLGVIVKTLVVVVRYLDEARNTAKHLDDISTELQVLTVVLGSLSSSLSVTTSTVVLDYLVQEIAVSVRGCTAIIKQIHEHVQKYQRSRIISKIGWATFGQTKMNRLCEKLEAYKAVLSISMQAIST